MKTILAISIFTVLTNIVFGQKETAAYKTIADSFEAKYNSGNFKAIFKSFSPDMQEALPLGKAREFFKGLKQQAGNLIKREFLKYDQTYASYSTTFERATLSMNISIDTNSKINGFFIELNTKPQNLPQPERNTARLILPFHEEWTVVWGGDTKETNYHIEDSAQKNALDLVVTDKKGRSFKNNGTANEDYYAFGKEIIAPCDGEVVLSVDGIKDNIPGVQNPIYVPGNTVIIKAANNEYLFFAHLKQQSITVKQGQKIKQGQLLGLCGNSGNSSEPHLHFHIQNVEDINIATGVKCYFEKIQVNGQTKTEYSPIQKEKIRNL